MQPVPVALDGLRREVLAGVLTEKLTEQHRERLRASYTIPAPAFASSCFFCSSMRRTASAAIASWRVVNPKARMIRRLSRVAPRRSNL